MALYVLAGPAEIFRSAQKDASICEILEQNLSDILLKTAGTNAWLRYRYLTQISAQFLYYGFTTLAGYQTLGEEYTGIMQVDSTLNYIPSRFKRSIMIILEAAGLTIINQYLIYIQKNVKNDTEISDHIRSRIINCINILKSILPFIQHFHRAIFYWDGKYYKIMRRILNINYIRTRPWLRTKRGMYGFKILGIITMLHLMSYTCYSVFKWYGMKGVKPTENNAVVNSDKNKCPLCLDTRIGTSTTPCGHLFCWACILNWLEVNDQCPLCRESVTSCRIVPLLNY